MISSVNGTKSAVSWFGAWKHLEHLWVMLIAKLRHRISHFREYKFKDSFQYILNLLFSCGKAIFPRFLTSQLLWRKIDPTGKKVRNIIFDISEKSNSRITQFSLHGDFAVVINFIILNSTVEYILGTYRFDELFFLEWSQLVLIWHSLFLSLWSMTLGTILCWQIIFST